MVRVLVGVKGTAIGSSSRNCAATFYALSISSSSGGR